MINPANGIKYPRRDENIPKILDNLSSLTLKEAVIHNLRDRALIELFLCAGIRTTEAANVKKTDIIWNGNKILIRIAKRKRVRYVFYSEICGQMMNEYLKSRSDNCPYLFISKYGDKFTRQGIWFVMKNYVKLTGLDMCISTHSLRHSFAQNLSDKGMEDEDIAKLLGHKNSRYVRRYSQFSLSHRKIKYDEFNH
ncbi:tyrosine-type recombinase/integrase [Desulfosporosinus fructosivorans]